MERLDLILLGDFEARIDGELVAEDAWSHGRSRDLVKLLALAPGHRLVRERVLEALWPHLDADAGAANLHKAAHHARRALGEAEAVVLREGEVQLAPGAAVETDVERFEASGDPDLYGGELLPGDRYAAWTQERRQQLRERRLQALREAGNWAEVAAAEPADEAAQRALMRIRLAAGDRPGALAAFESLREALAEHGLQPSVGLVAFHARIAGGAALDGALAKIDAEIEQASVAERADLMATRADLLMAIGDRGAASAYGAAAAAAGPDGVALRIRQAWAQLAGGEPGAAEATLAPLAPSSDAERAGHLVTDAAAAWFRGDVETASRLAAEAYELAQEAGLTREARGALEVESAVAHSSGAWGTALEHDLGASLRAPDLADTLFDGHLCIGQYALRGASSHGQLREVAEELHANSLRTGARRAQAFAATLLGEVALAAGRTEEAEERLGEAIRTSREIGAITSEALASLRLGETERARGKEARAEALLADALALSRWSPLSRHLQPLSYAALVVPPSQPQLGCRWLEQAEPELAEIERPCVFCGVSFDLAAAIAAARAGEPARAGERVAAAEEAVGLWPEDAWRPSLEEARGETALARGDAEEARQLLAAAAEGFAGHGRRLDADRAAARLAELS
ncbi:MAG TPA: BTAD domain-containing putative transcriptional regulator [Solirubrobacterales bacterium]|nr:BTAD domain-containing putative transcriptional regulator [Solirubrobacterales bacterium]